MKYKHVFSALLAIGMLNSVAFAGLGQGQYTINIENLKQAKKLRDGTKVAFVCEGCKTFQPSIIDKKKSFLSFFNSNSTHGCPGCGGQVTVKTMSGQAQNITVYTHVCTKCGANRGIRVLHMNSRSIPFSERSSRAKASVAAICRKGSIR